MPPETQTAPALTIGLRPSTAPVPARAGALAADLEKCYAIAVGTRRPSLLRWLEAWIWHFEVGCIAVYRFSQWARRLRARSLLAAMPFLVLSVIATYFVRLIRHVEISQRAEIGGGLHLGHPSCIFIGPTHIGVNCNVTHNVTIGVGLGAQPTGIPIIGNNVWIGPGATLTGGIVIGDGVTIAAGSVVNRDVPSGALVAGNPARVVNASYDNASLLWPELVP